MPTIRVGQAAPDAALQTIEGDTVPLAAAWQRGESALLLFLRHLAWLPCKEHVAQVVSHHSTIASMGATVVLISFGTPHWARVWMEETASPFPVLLDPTRAAYCAYGLARSRLRSWNLPTLWYYTKALARGEKLGGQRGDPNQLGGNFIVDGRGVVQFAYPSRDPTDRPDVETLIARLRECA